MTRPWSDLPPEILSAIGKRLESIVDVFLFRSVCKNWRSFQNPNPNPNLLSRFLPRKISNPTLPFTDRHGDPLLLVARTVFLVKSLHSDDDSDSGGWILTVEEINPGKLRILYPLSNDPVTNLSANFPKSLNLLGFRVSEIYKGYGIKFTSDEEDVSGVQKVVLCSNCTIMVLYGKGTLVGVRLKSGKWGYVRHSLISSFSDVLSFNGMLYAVDCRGNLYAIDYKTMKVIKTIVNYFHSCYTPTYNLRCFVGSNGKLCLVVWDSRTQNGIDFRVYSLLQRNWEYTTPRSLGCGVVFVSSDSCFPWTAKYSTFWYDHVVYSKDCLDSSVGCSRANRQLFASVNLHIGIYSFIRHSYSTTDSMKIITKVLWLPPTWFWSDTYSSSGDEEENDELDFGILSVPNSSEEVWPPSSVFKGMVQSTEIPSLGPFFEEQAVANLPTTIDLEHVDEQASVAKINGLDIHTISGNYHDLTIQKSDHNASTVMFKGVDIKPHLVPTLQKIWAKYGNIMERSTMRNSDMIARAQESLAMSVFILQNNSGRSLNKTQADYLSSASCDLQHMCLKVDWLAPFVEKALVVYKSRPLIDAVKKFSEARAQAVEKKSKVLDEVAKLDLVKEDVTLVSEKLSVLESIDLDQCLGEGLC